MESIDSTLYVHVHACVRTQKLAFLIAQPLSFFECCFALKPNAIAKKECQEFQSGCFLHSKKLEHLYGRASS